MDNAIRTGCTCITCRLVFASVDLQKQHYSSEWHRYNVKRQIADLPPISEEQFEFKIKSHQEAKDATDKKRRSKKSAALKSSDEEEDADMESEQAEDPEDYDESKAIPETVCLFCSTSSDSFDENLMHMSKKHGFFIPDSNYCSDPEGLIQYLGEKVGCGYFCISCPNKRFRDLNSCQLHMRDKSHCIFSVEGERVVEYLDFYDYGELLQDETDEDDGGAIDLGYSLVLPSGAILGHRTLVRYYKQRLRATPSDAQIQASKAARRLQQSQLKALGWTGTTGSLAVQRARDFKYMKNVVKKNMMRRDLHSNKLFKSRGRDDQQ